jgi:YVTN family beta-propeller protein
VNEIRNGLFLRSDRAGTRVALVALCVAAGLACGSAAGKAKAKRVPNYGPIVTKTIRTDTQPCGVVEGFGAIWVTAFGSGTLQRLDPTTNRITGSVKISSQPCGLAVGAGAVWVNGYGSNSVERVDPQALKVVEHIQVGTAPFDVLFAAGSVWTTNMMDRNVMRIDPATNQVVATIPVGEAPAGLGFAAGSVWVGTNSSDVVYRIDPSSHRVEAISTGKSWPAWLSTRDDQVWVGSINDGVALRIDPVTNRVAAVVRVRTNPVDGVVDERGLVWIPNRGNDSVSIIDAASATLVTTLRVGRTPFVLNDGFGDVWSPSYGGSDVRRLRPPRIVEAVLDEVGGSGQSGRVRLIAVAAKRTRVIVTLQGAAATEVVHIHGGRCGAFRAARFAPWRLRGGRGSVLVKTPIRTLASGKYALDVHRTTRERTYVACANLG